MNKVGLMVMLQARPGKEAEVEQFLRFCGPAGRCGNGNNLVVCIQSKRPRRSAYLTRLRMRTEEVRTSAEK